MISPPGPVVWVAEHDSLVLTCSNVACYTCVTWTKDNSDVVDEGFTIKVSKQSPDNDLHVYDIVARKPKVTPSDEGNFTCESASQKETVYVNVIESKYIYIQIQLKLFFSTTMNALTGMLVNEVIIQKPHE